MKRKDKVKYYLIEGFHFKPKERVGIVVLLILILLIFILPHYIQPAIEEETDFSAFEAEIENWKSEDSSSSNSQVQGFLSTPTPLHGFDPNKISKEQLIAFGVSPKTAQTILNYRSKGGRFKTKEDLKKIYTLEEEVYNRLASYVVFEEVESKAKKTNTNSENLVAKKPQPALFTFDPNTATREIFLQLGLSSKVASTIINYRNKGGQFRKPEDFAKIYGLEKEQFEQLLPFIEIKSGVGVDDIASDSASAWEIKGAGGTSTLRDTLAEEFTAKGGVANFNEEDRATRGAAESSTPIVVDINKATVEEWQMLRGIGPYYSKKIVKFREALGGFVSVEQIGDTYNLPDSVFQKIKPYLQPSPILRKLNINTATIDELKMHPYIKWQDARVIVNYRKQHGDYQSPKDIEKILAFDAAYVEKILPYLSVE